jgi:hypothetical protein
MTATLEIDDELYRQAADIANRTGREISELVTDGLRLVIHPASTGGKGARGPESPSLKEVRAMAEKAFRNAPPGKTAREILVEERARLDRE